MCIIDIYIYSVFYHAFIMRAPCIGVRCWLLLFNKHCFVYFYYRLYWHFCWFMVANAITCWCTCGFIGPSLRYACICWQSSNPVYCRGVYPPRNMCTISPTRGSSKGGPGGSSPSLLPHGAQRKIFVEYNWTSAVKIVVLLVNYFKN